MITFLKHTTRTTLFVLALALPVAGCGGGDGHSSDMPAVSMPRNESEVRNFTDAELDSLRAMKQRNGVIRDEYWDDRGGVVANDVVEVWYPPGKLTVSHGMYVLDWVMKCRRRVAELFGEVPDQHLQIICTQTMEAYTDFTGRQWWNYAAISKDRIIYQPVPVMVARGILDIAVPREYYEWAIERIARGRAPRWIVEGTAARLANEETILIDNLSEFPEDAVTMDFETMEETLEADNDRKAARFAYYNAYRMVKRIDHEFGLDAVAVMLKAIGEGSSLDSASKIAFELPYDELVARAREWSRPSTRENE